MSSNKMITPPLTARRSRKTKAVVPRFALIFSIICGKCLHSASSATSASDVNYLHETFRDPSNNGVINHFTIDPHTGKVYIGAVNRLYQLTERLAVVQRVNTGPKDDSPYCPPVPTQRCECSTGSASASCEQYVKRPTDAVNKALLIDSISQKLIVCTNLFQGHCERRELGDITVKLPDKWTPLVPNDATSSVVMFIAAGPQDEMILYMAATRSIEGNMKVYKDMIPAISSRQLDDFEIAHKGVSTATKKDIETQQKETFRVTYVYGFSSDGFSYFLSVQKDTIDSMKYVTRIIRVCQGDVHYYSYTEIPLQCHVNGTEYNILVAAHVAKSGRNLARSLDLADEPPFSDSEHVLFGVFARSRRNTDKVTNDSALCVYSLREIRSKFTANIQTCFRGIGNTGPAHIVKEIGCVEVINQYPISDDFCALANGNPVDINTPIAGLDPVNKVAALHYRGTLMTSIIVATVHADYTVAFVGTSQGHLKKMVVNTGTNATEYETVVVDEGNRVNRDMAFDHSGSYVYVVTTRKVTRVKVEECGQYETCSVCLGARDPYCGWCTFEKRCTVKKTCTRDDTDLSWLSFSKAQCTKIASIIPQQVQIQKDRARMLSVTIQNMHLPRTHTYKCAFSGYGVSRTSPAVVLANQNGGSGVNRTVQCETPNSNLLPVIPTGQDHIVMRLSVQMNGKDFVSSNLTFFDCRLHSSCTSCTNSNYPCTWCIRTTRERQCVFDRESCNNDILVTGKSVEGATDRPGPEFCPRIESSFTKILVPSGTEKQVKVKAIHIEDFQTDFKCIFKDGHREVDAVKSGSEITCNPVRFSYTTGTPYRNVPFHVIWGPQKRRLDNPDNIQVKVYQCSAMASNCGECLTADHKFECGWCDGRCSIEDDCTDGTWLSNSHDCPNPTITRFYPMTGPREGGTNVTIVGQNLGKTFDDIRHSVIVARVICLPYEELYVPSKRIVCLTGANSRRQSKSSGSIEVVVNKKHRTSSSQSFSYVSPKIRGFQPNIGPKAGGTKVTIRGRYLNAGSRKTATVVGMPCHVIRTSPSAAVCVTSVNPMANAVGLVEMTFDLAQISYTGESKFRYVDNPTILVVREEKGIVSGGTKVTVIGQNLDVIQDPHMVVYVNNKKYISDCGDVTETEMTCQTPDMHESTVADLVINPNQPVTLHYGFIMDNVTELRNMTSYVYTGNHEFSVYPDPSFDRWKSPKNFQLTSEYLTINGENLNLVLTKDDVTVQIGDASCIVSSISQTQLTCQPPDPEVEGVGNDPHVVVFIGRNLSIPIGHLRYEGPQTHFPLPVIIGIIAAASVLILIIVIICIAYHRQSQESGRVMKRMQNQMDKLEASVAKECKEAFAELQTDITELTNDLCGPAGIPFRSYQAFCMKVLFPNVPTDEHPVTRGLNLDTSTSEGLRRFNQLIGNKTFLLLFIRTLERNQNFSMRERVNVASLLSVALQNRMEYHTDILKTLLAELIEKSMEGRSFHPKLFLRRTESVAEKMLTNWFTFMLYKFLQECAGEPLFVLFRAIKQQVDKGPVDNVTSEAKYSLSEDKLIRQMVDYSPMTIHILESDYQYGNTEYVVKVLDCDTISQVREKILDTIYRNIPHSSWPNKDTLDLQWRNGKRGRVILQDEDMTTKPEGEHKRYNTLAHYKVSDGALMALVPKQASQSLSNSSGISHHKFVDGLYSGSPSFSRSLSPAAIQMDIDGGSSKFYHLVKHPDSELHSEGDRSNKMVSEIYLTRLLATKGTLQQYVDDLFETIFSTANRISVMPLAIKYMFDFLDDQALHHGITDPEVVHTWKSNSLPLRFWVNVVKNPDFVFDVCKSNIVDSCLSVVAQTFMDSCSMSEHRLGKDSPSSKLLYAKDIPKYKKWVERYYQDIKLMPAISDQDMNVTLAEETKLHQNEFNLDAALNELYSYAVRYNDELMQTLEEDEFARNYQLAHRLDQVHELMESDA